jgi:hypothetical protein
LNNLRLKNDKILASGIKRIIMHKTEIFIPEFNNIKFVLNPTSAKCPSITTPSLSEIKNVKGFGKIEFGVREFRKPAIEGSMSML